MTLNRRIVALLFAGITLYTLVGFAVHQYLILPSFLQLEAAEARKDVLRCVQALDAQLDQIDLLCFDWAAWDDTYAFIDTPDDAYQASNLIPESFLDNHINFIYFYRKDGDLVWGKFYNLETGQPMPCPEFTQHRWAATHPLLNHRDRSSVVRGVFTSSHGPLLLVARPILPSEESENEEVRGTMIMGRLLDQRIVNIIRDRTQVAVDILGANGSSLPAETQGLAPGEIQMIPESRAILRVMTGVADIQGALALVVQVTIPRTILARGQTAIRLDMLAVAIAGFLFLAMLLLSLKWVVTDPLQQLSDYVRRVDLTKGPRPIIVANRRDEIGLVAREFNTMIARLQSEEADRVAAEAALRMSEARVKTILDTAPDAMLIIEDNGRIESANQAAARLFGFPPEEFPGMDAGQLLGQAGRADFRALMTQYDDQNPTNPAPAAMESVGLTRERNEFPLHLSMSSIHLGGVRHFIAAIRDISALKAMQQKMARHQHLARIGEMGATVAHEIRNPLAGIKGALQVLTSTQLPPEEQDEAVREIHILVNRIAHTVEQLLRYARTITPQPSRVPLRPLIESVSRDVPEGARLDISCDETLHLHVDPALFRQVLDNIWHNACQALSPGGRLQWRGSRTDHDVEIALVNDGPPIPEAIRDQVFEPFFTTRVDGSGLGLAVSLRIVEAHGGTITLENTDGGPVMVVVRVPLGER